MSYTILTTYFFNLNNFEKIIKRQSLRKNLLHKVHNFVLNYKFRNLNENYFENKILQDKLLYIYHKLNMKCPCHRSLILKSIKKLLVKLRYLFNILKKKTFCSFTMNILLISIILKHWLENKLFCKFLRKFCNFSLISENF